MRQFRGGGKFILASGFLGCATKGFDGPAVKVENGTPSFFLSSKDKDKDISIFLIK
jgi:hypothetical protein